MKASLVFGLVGLLTVCAWGLSPLDPLPSGDRIPNFSTVGYHHGDVALPNVPVTATVTPPADGSDATARIQQALETARVPGAVLLKAGTYNVAGTLRLKRSGLVLRGEGEKTKLVATARRQYTLVEVGSRVPRQLGRTRCKIEGEHVPVGQAWVKVEKASLFKKGDRVAVSRPGTATWIHDLKMDQIPPRQDGGKVSQWTPRRYNLLWEREVRRVDADAGKVYFDAPLVMALDAKYGGGELIACSRARLQECGVENLLMESVYDPSVKDKQGRWVDEKHAWTAISMYGVENGWVRGVKSRYFGNNLVALVDGARLCTVTDCRSEMPVSLVKGGRRYAFYMGGCEMCLIKDCTMGHDRHGCVTGACVCGPNVFLRCTGTHAWSDFGPHHRWATGCLYDNVKTDGALNVQDRGSAGSGHGWAGANFVLWNCTARTLVCQNPWASAQNWCVGCTGRIDGRKGQTNTSFAHPDGQTRPDCVRTSAGKPVQPVSLYEYQLAHRPPLERR